MITSKLFLLINIENETFIKIETINSKQWLIIDEKLK